MSNYENTFLQIRFPGPALSSWNVPLDEVEFNLYWFFDRLNLLPNTIYKLSIDVVDA